LHRDDIFYRRVPKSTVYATLLRFRSSGYPNFPAYKPIVSAAHENLFINDKYYPQAYEAGFNAEISYFRNHFGDP
jgi:hypothetical protein